MGLFALVVAGGVALGIVALLVKPLYQQIGSTCGFYALIYGVSKIQRINKKKITRRIIIDFINSEESYVGEIFDIETMLDIIQKYFPEIKAQIVPISGMQDLDQQLKNNYVIYPCKYGKTPHYYFLEASEKSQYIYRHMVFWKKSKMDKEELYLQNSNLSELPEYIWKDYFDKEEKGWNGICTKMGELFTYVSDRVLYKRLREAKEQRREMLYDKKSKVNMCGKILIIQKSCK